MTTREETIRSIDGSDVVLRDLVEDLTGKKITASMASDINDMMIADRDTANNPPKVTRNKQYHSQKVWAEKRRKREKAETKLRREEEAFARLMVKLKAGDPSDKEYAKKLNIAKKTTRIREELPKAAQKKWANPEFRKKMEARGMHYNVAEWKGWLPYDEAKRLQQTLIGAKSRGEYEVYMKLWSIRWLPARPDRVYGEAWLGWNDFLGTVNFFGAHRRDSVKAEEYKSFYDALTFARSLKLKNVKEWRAACKDGRVPLDVPIDPHNVYPNDFVSIDHWLGNEKAINIIKGEVVASEDVWVLYGDGRQDACWWAKMSLIKYQEFKQHAITPFRVYEFEGGLAGDVWQIFEDLSEMYEDDQRERYLEGNALQQITERLDQILKWKVNA